ncbi:MAG: TonB-dependent receptor [Pseudomonadota bacterium]
MNLRKSLLGGAGLAGVLIALSSISVAQAQTDPSDNPDAADEDREVIIVTARKREERLIDVPVVSTVLTEAQLENFQTTDFFNVGDRVAGLVVGDNVGNVGANITIRGIGSTSFNPATDGAVSVNVDGLQFSHGDVLRSAFFDVEAIEVLKGPQALFFGKNSPGGVISLRTADPTDEYEVMGSFGYEFEADEFLGQGVVSGPLTDWLGARLAVSYSSQEGYFNNIAEPTPGLGGAGPEYDRISNSETFFGRATFVVNATDKLSARVKFSHEDRSVDGDGGSAQISGCDVPFDPIEACTLNRDFALADLDPLPFTNPLTGSMILNNGVPFQDTYRTFGTIELDYELTDEITLTSVTGLSAFNHEFLINGTYQPGTVDQLSPFVGFPGSVTIAAVNEMYQRYITEEFRITSDFADSPLNFMVGVFYEDGFMQYDRDVRIPSFGLYFDDTNEIDINTISAFGQAIFDVTDTFEVAAGVRYTNEERDLRTVDNGLTLTLMGPIAGVGEVTNAVPTIEEDDVSPEATVTWRPNSNLTIFGAYKEAFKSGSFNVDQPLPLDRSYGSETAQGGEIGLKAALLDGNLLFNLAGYRYTYDDLQVSRSVNLPGGGGTLLQVVNAASAKVTGIDVDASYSPPEIDGLTLFAAVNFNDGEFDEFEDAACYGGQTDALGCNLNFSAAANQVAPGVFLGGFTAQDLSGRDLPRSPQWSANFGFDFEQPVAGTGLNLGVSSNTSYTDDMVLDVSYNPRTFQDSFIKTNASIRLAPDNRAWELALIGNNLSDKITSSTCNSGPFDQAGGLVPNPSGLPFNPIIPDSTDQALCFTQPGRELWIRLTVRPTNWN